MVFGTVNGATFRHRDAYQMEIFDLVSTFFVTFKIMIKCYTRLTILLFFYFRYLLFYHKKVLEYEWLRRSLKKVRSNKIITMFFDKLPKKLYILINTVFMSVLQVKQASLPFWSKNPWRLHTNYFLGKSGCANLLFFAQLSKVS